MLMGFGDSDPRVPRNAATLVIDGLIDSFLDPLSHADRYLSRAERADRS
ncbi:hypothetical protein PUN28_018502 [Cardiocondyla obscurior]|uniref:Uncharacterized protein n=1 Tax=Cardiocondyla obscurior TaxID=286306 RepID=A0AAW2EHZ5_9HYME